MKTQLIRYRFDVSEPDQKQAWEGLKAKLKKTNGKVFESHGGKSHYYDLKDGEITLEDKHLFNNQWNCEQGRVFDWALDYKPNRNIKQGHYLVITDEMTKARHDRFQCGYCGKQEDNTQVEFCPYCIDSEYLEQKDLHLTRMQRVDDKSKRAPLSEQESATRIPLFVQAQTYGATERGKARIAKQRLDIITKANNTIKHAETERDGMLWLLDHGLKIDNVIWYAHTGKFSFGWRKPVENEVRAAILEVISEFPFEYEIKYADGKTLG